jgi:hypothetical protein
VLQRTAVAGAAFLAAVALGGCAGSGDPDAAADRTASPSTAPEENGDEPPGNAGDAPEKPPGKTFDDPQGEYTIVIGKTWKSVPPGKTGVPNQAETEFWVIGPAEKGFAPNVNVLTQDTQGLDLEGYKKLSERQAREGDLKLVRSRIVTSTSGEDVGLLEYTGDPTGAGTDASFLAVYAVADGTAVIATLSTDTSTYRKHRTKVQPYLLTLTKT